jgi:hypothetical protein
VTPKEAANLLIDELERLGVPYMVTGGLAANTYGVPRATHDADVVVQLSSEAYVRLAQELPDGLFLDPQISFETITGSQRQIVKATKTGVPFQIELFYLSGDAHHLERFNRRRFGFLPDLSREAHMATAEDMVIQKIRWNREKDREDVLNIIAVQGSALDFGYIEKWCSAHGTLERLRELQSKIPPI